MSSFNIYAVVWMMLCANSLALIIRIKDNLPAFLLMVVAFELLIDVFLSNDTLPGRLVVSSLTNVVGSCFAVGFEVVTSPSDVMLLLTFQWLFGLIWLLRSFQRDLNVVSVTHIRIAKEVSADENNPANFAVALNDG